MRRRPKGGDKFVPKFGLLFSASGLSGWWIRGVVNLAREGRGKQGVEGKKGR